MDRAVSTATMRWRTLKRVALGIAGLMLVWAVWSGLPGLLRPAVARERIRTAVVERGNLEATLEASGTVVPAFEGVLSSPIGARVTRILRRPGEAVSEGDAILELDSAATRLELERLEEKLDQKANEGLQARLALESKLEDLRSSIETRRLDVGLARYRLEQQRKLHDHGLTAQEALRQAEVEERKASIGLSQLERTVENEQRSYEATQEGIDLGLRILTQERDQARRRLQLATTRADRAGVVTWVVEEEGTTVNQGDVLARVADLASFRVEASISDAYASRLSAGRPVRARAGDRELSGHVSGVRPAIEDGVVRFDVELDEPSDPLLRQNLRIDVHVVTDTLTDVLRVAKGPFARGGSLQDVFVIRGDMAHRTRARFGLSGKEHYRIVEGLREGDEVIISDMSAHVGREQIAVF